MEPDILISGKGIASGLPLGAMIARDDLMVWGLGAHGSTYGGSAISCAAALATIDLIEAEGSSRTPSGWAQPCSTASDVAAQRHDSSGTSAAARSGSASSFTTT